MSNPTIEKSLTDNRQALQATLSQIPIRGESVDLIKSLKIAQLALKKRGEESTGEKRVIVFVGSPLQHSQEDLQKIGSIFKRYNISVDVINFGETTANQEKLEAFVEAVDTDGTSHIVTVPQGPHLLSDMVASSEILTEPGQPAGAPGGAADFGGMEDDPEYAMALQLSLQEFEREQQQRREQEGGDTKGETTTQQSTTAPTTQAQEEQMEDDEVDMDEDEMMRQALEMSRAEFQQQEQPRQQPVKDEEKIAQQPEIPRPEEDMYDDDEDEALQAALRMSMMQSNQPASGGETIDDIMGDEAFLQDVVSNVTKDKKDEDKKDDDAKK